MSPRPRCPSCGRITPHSIEEVGDIPTGAIQALAPHMGTLLKLGDEYDLESADEHGPIRDFMDSLALNVKAAMDGKVAGQPNRKRPAKAA